MSLKKKDSLDPTLTTTTYDEGYPTTGIPYYSNNGLGYTVTTTEDNKVVEKIEVLIKALGTMVLVPNYETDPEDFVKRYVDNIQHPILEGDIRDNALKVMSELISQL